VEQPVPLAGGAVVIEKPRDPDDLISEADFVRDERLPYWADLWPSAIMLAEFVEREHRAPGPGLRAIELGCGLGLVTIAAQRAGYTVTATDYYDDAVLFAARNAHRATGTIPPVRMVDWRALPDDLGAFDLVLAADVLYEREYGPLMASVIQRLLAPGGHALVSDQGRLALGAFLEACVMRGLRTAEVFRTSRPGHGATSQGATHTLTIHEVRLA
jgi:predicted nicotinamide N-methyase